MFFGESPLEATAAILNQNYNLQRLLYIRTVAYSAYLHRYFYINICAICYSGDFESPLKATAPKVNRAVAYSENSKFTILF